MKLALIVALLMACVAPTAPDGARPFEPPVYYPQLLADVAACAGVTPSFTVPAIHFASIAAPQFPCPGSGVEAIGCTDLRTMTIYFAEPYEYMPWVVKHELLHVLLRRTDHPPVFAACHLLNTQH